MAAALGVAVSLGAAASRLPQVVRIALARSTAGLHEGMFRADLLCNAVTALYHRTHGYPLNTCALSLPLIKRSPALSIASDDACRRRGSAATASAWRSASRMRPSLRSSRGCGPLSIGVLGLTRCGLAGWAACIDSTAGKTRACR